LRREAVAAVRELPWYQAFPKLCCINYAPIFFSGNYLKVNLWVVRMSYVVVDLGRNSDFSYITLLDS
jgi:hypothetical protein